MAPPEAKSEYSTGPERSGGGLGAQLRLLASGGGVGGGIVPTAVLVLGGLGALLLVVAEFTNLYVVRAQTTGDVVKSVTAGSHNTYALVLIGLLAGAMAYGVWQWHSRPALLALGLLGLVALLIALLGDLPDAHQSGLLRGVEPGAGTGFVLGASTPAAGFYLETLGAVVLLAVSVGGFVLLGPPPKRHGVDTPVS